ncbi:MAG TPA: DUF2066 domain-containing protein [Rhodanobacteraceae bacterium]
MRYLMTLILLSGLVMAAAPVARAQQATSPNPAPAPVSHPYQATVPVADTSGANRDQAFAQALAQVLARVSGNAPPAAVLGQASTYVQNYQYRHAPAGAAQPFLLTVEFAPSAIEHVERVLDAAVPAAPAPAGSAAATPSPVMGNVQEMWVSGIHSAFDFADAVAAINGQPGVGTVSVRAADAGGMLLDVHTSMPLAQVVRGLVAGGHFTMSRAGHAGAAASVHWQK